MYCLSQIDQNGLIYYSLYTAYGMWSLLGLEAHQNRHIRVWYRLVWQFNQYLNDIPNNNWNVLFFLDRLMGCRPVSVNPTRESTTQKAFWSSQEREILIIPILEFCLEETIKLKMNMTKIMPDRNNKNLPSVLWLMHPKVMRAQNWPLSL